MLRCVNGCVTTIEPGHQTMGNARAIWSDESSYTLFPASGRVYVWKTHKEAYHPECLVSTVKHGGGSVMVWAAISWYSILFAPLLPFHGRITKMEYVASLGNHVPPMIQTLFPIDRGFPRRQCPIHTAGTVQSWFEEHEGGLQHLPWPA
jgi:hypothetical protein